MLFSSSIATSHLAQVLQPRLLPHQTFSYKVNAFEKDFDGPGEKVAKTFSQTWPIQITAVKIQGGKTAVTVTTGPLVVRGRSVGRPKVNDYEIDKTNSLNGKAFALVGIVFPVGGVKLGQVWQAKFRGSPPLTAGLSATYKYTKATTLGGQKVALLSVSVSGDEACRTRGGGKLVVGAQDGIVRSGKLHFDIAYLRPGRGKSLVVNSHDGLDYTITP